ncbi:hypothetical protein BH23PSE1_BH23PSE1_09030 [soil metagenome]
MVWSFSWLRGWDEVWDEAHLSQWRGAFLPGSGARVLPFMHPDVVRAWVRAHAALRPEPFFMTARHSDGRQAQLLFVRLRSTWRRAYVRRMIAVGENLFDYNEPLVLPSPAGATDLGAEFWSAFFREMGRRAGRWFDTMPPLKLRDSSLGDAATGKPAEEAIRVFRLDRHADAEAYLMSRSKPFRRAIRKAEKTLQGMGELAFKVHGPDDLDAVMAWMPTFAAHRASRYPGSAPASAQERYFSILAQEGIASGVVHCSSLTLDGRGLAWEVNFHVMGVFYRYACAFDADYVFVSTGSLLNFRNIEWLMANGAHTYDFMRGAESYKDSWTDGETVGLHRLDIPAAAALSRVRLTACDMLRRLGRTRPAPAAAQGWSGAAAAAGAVQAEPS